MRCLLLLITIYVCVANSQQLPRRLTIREAAEMAVQMNPAVQVAHLRALEAKADATGAASAYKPQLNAYIYDAVQTNNLRAIGIAVPGFTDRLGPYRVFNARSVLTQTVFDSSLRARIRAARERVELADPDAASIREETIAAVLELYLRMLQAASRVRAAEATAALDGELVDQATKLEVSGEGNKLQLAIAEQQRSSGRIKVIGAQQEVRTLKALLLETIGLSADEEIELEPDADLAIPDKEADAAEAFTRRSEFRALQAKILAARSEELSERRERLPKIHVSADYGMLGAGPDRGFSTFNVSGGVTVPLWTGGRQESRTESAILRTRQLEVGLARLKLAVIREVSSAHIEMDACLRTAEETKSGLAAATTAFQLTRARLGAGLVTSVDVATASARMTELNEMNIRSRFNCLLAEVHLARSNGTILSYLQ